MPIELRDPDLELTAQEEGLLARKGLDPDAEYWFHVQTLPGLVRQNVTLAGVTFVAFTEPPIPGRLNEGGPTKRAHRPGDYVRLTGRKYVEVLRCIRSKRQRWFGEPPVRGDLLDARDEWYRETPGDEPIARYLRIERVDAPPPLQLPNPKVVSALEAELEELEAEEVELDPKGEARARKKMRRAKQLGQKVDLLGEVDR